MKITKPELEYIIKEELENVLNEANIIDYMRKGFKKLLEVPKMFDQLVAKAKANFQNVFKEKLHALAKDPEIVEIGKNIATTINQAGTQKIQEILNEEEGDGRKLSLSPDELRKLGVSDQALQILLDKSAETHADAVIGAAAAAVGKPIPPNLSEFLKRFFKRSSKMMMFGFIDNFIMIIAGDAIDANIAATFGLATMTSAAFGNMISDMGGEEAGEALDSAIEKLGLDAEDVSDEQMEAAPSWMRFLDRRAGTIGVAIGCLIGMFPLAFMEEKGEKNGRILV